MTPAEYAKIIDIVKITLEEAFGDKKMTCPQYGIPCPFWSPSGNCVGTLEHCRGRKKK